MSSISQKFPLSPYQASYYNWLVVWDKGYTADTGVPATNPGLLGIIAPTQVSTVVDTPVSLASYLGWPTNLPFNTSRRLHVSTDADGWEIYSGTLIYQNYWGMYMSQTITLPISGAPVTFGTELQDISFPDVDANAAACSKFFYPNRLVDFIITKNSVGVAPDGNLYIDFDSQGMAEFNIQESVNYGSSNFSLEILTDNMGSTPSFETLYTVLGSNYPRYVFDNQQNISPPGPLVLSSFFLPYGSASNPFTSTTTPFPSSVVWCATEDFPIGTTPQNGNSFTNLPSNGGLLNVLVDIGNARRDPTALVPYNKANLLISLIQNGITS